MKAIEDCIRQSNARLKMARVGVAILMRGDRLCLRATFPPRPGSRFTKPTQQILALGIRANHEGLNHCEKLAKKIGGELSLGCFRWDEYIKIDSEESSSLVSEWIDSLESDYFSRRKRTSQSQTTWHDDYWRIYRRLPPDRLLTADMMREAILATPPDSRTRRRCCQAMIRLAQFAGISEDFSPLMGNYSLRSVLPRSLPSDDEILNWRDRIPSDSWRWVYGAIACYGLRGHEVFYLDLSNFPEAHVTAGKTGGRIVFPIWPDWASRWQLDRVLLPECTGRNNSDLGNRVTHAFKRYELPVRPYDLRHAWAVRSMEFGLDLSLAAQQMGHSTDVHSRIYHHWISATTHRRAYQQLATQTRITGRGDAKT